MKMKANSFTFRTESEDNFSCFHLVPVKDKYLLNFKYQKKKMFKMKINMKTKYQELRKK